VKLSPERPHLFQREEVTVTRTVATTQRYKDNTVYVLVRILLLNLKLIPPFTGSKLLKETTLELQSA
jgi:hypothetical protein